MEMLLAAGGDVELQDNNNTTVLSWTTSYKVCCEKLLLHFANVLNADALYDIKHYLTMLCCI